MKPTAIHCAKCHFCFVLNFFVHIIRTSLGILCAKSNCWMCHVSAKHNAWHRRCHTRSLSPWHLESKHEFRNASPPSVKKLLYFCDGAANDFLTIRNIIEYFLMKYLAPRDLTFLVSSKAERYYLYPVFPWSQHVCGHVSTFSYRSCRVPQV